MRVFTTRFWRSAALLFLLGATGAGVVRADEALRQVQQSLRDQGFYYGPIDGSPGDETTQALRRYQIRNGLAVNGQLNDETRRSIQRTGGSNNAANNTGSRSMIPGDDMSTPAPLSTPTRRAAPTYAAPAPTPTPAYRPPPARPRADPDEQDDVPPAPRGVGPGNIRPDLRVSPDAPVADGGGYIPRGGIAPSVSLNALFASTPYEFAPPPVQADVLKRAQFLLARNGFYDGRADGAPGPSTADALANFQEVNRLRRTGRLDVNTLGVMRLLPGRQMVGPRRDGDPRRGPDIIFQGRVVD